MTRHVQALAAAVIGLACSALACSDGTGDSGAGGEGGTGGNGAGAGGAGAGDATGHGGCSSSGDKVTCDCTCGAETDSYAACGFCESDGTSCGGGSGGGGATWICARSVVEACGCI